MAGNEQELEARATSRRWTVVLGADAHIGRAFLARLFESKRRFPEAIVALPSAEAWMTGDFSPDTLAANAFRDHRIHLVPVDALRASLDDVRAARDDRPLVILRIASRRLERSQLEVVLGQAVAYVSHQGPAVFAAVGLSRNDVEQLTPLIEILAEEDPKAPFVTIASQSFEAFAAAQFKDVTAFFDRHFANELEPTMLVGKPAIEVRLNEVLVDPSLRLDNTWRVPTAVALTRSNTPNDQLSAYEALWWLDERRFAPTIPEDFLEWWALDRNGPAFRRQALAHYEKSVLNWLADTTPREHNPRAEIVVPVEPAAGATVFLHQIALAAAREGHPTFVLRALARNFNPNQLKDFLLSLGVAGGRVAKERGTTFTTPTALVVLDTHHDVPQIRDALDEVWMRFRANVLVLRASLDRTEGPTLTQALTPSELERVPAWLQQLVGAKFDLPALSKIDDLRAWVDDLHRKTGGAKGHGFFRLLNETLRSPEGQEGFGVVTQSLRRRMERLVGELSGELGAARKATRELTMVLELAKAKRVSSDRGERLGLGLPLTALRATADEAVERTAREEAQDDGRGRERLTADQVAAFLEGRFQPRLTPSNNVETFIEVTSEDFARQWFTRVDLVERSHGEDISNDAYMIDFEQDILEAFVQVARGATESSRVELALLAGVDGDELAALPTQVDGAVLLRRVLRVLAAGSGEQDFCERVSEVSLRGTTTPSDWEDGGGEHRVTLYKLINRDLVRRSRVLLHHEAMVLRRSTWWKALSQQDKERRLDRAIENLELADSIPWQPGRRDDSPTHLKTTMGLCLRARAVLTGNGSDLEAAKEALRAALRASSRGTADSPHTRLALAEILIEDLEFATKRAPGTDGDRERWLDLDGRRALETAPLLATHQTTALTRWKRARERLLKILESLAVETEPFQQLATLHGWIEVEASLLEKLTRARATTADREALVVELTALAPAAPRDLATMIRNRIADMLIELQEERWIIDRERQLDELYSAISEGKTQQLTIHSLFRWAVAKFQLAQYGPGAAMYQELRTRSDTRSLPAERVLLRGSNGLPLVFAGRVERQDGDELHLVIEEAGRTLFRARGRVDQLGESRRGSSVRGINVRLGTKGPRAIPERFTTRTR